MSGVKGLSLLLNLRSGIVENVVVADLSNCNLDEFPIEVIDVISHAQYK